ncbi:MAG: DNA primase [Elusimicrobiota bacterium]|jgi:DNA primase|nr:DNA primase [Elusimicrobiota bacterium]
MAIPEEILDRIKTSNDLESVAREYLPDLKRSGHDWKACCPFHHEKTPSFSISPQRGIFKCFGCNAAGDVFKFVQMMDNISWIEAVKKLAQRASIEIPKSGVESASFSQKTILFDILESAANFYHKCLLKSSKSQQARQYLYSRGINDESIKTFKLGYAPTGLLIKAAAKKSVDMQNLIKAGVVRMGQSGLFEYMSERIVFPIFDLQGRVVALGGRTLSAEKTPKYLNTPETILFSKSANLYGLFQTLPQTRKERAIIVLEGYMDAIMPYQFGVSGAVAPLGTAFSVFHAKTIARYADKVTILFDSDDAGRNAAQKALECLIENSSLETTVSALPENIDADEFLIKYGKDEFLKMVKSTAKNPIEFIIDTHSKNITSAESKAKAIAEVLIFISKAADEIVQDEWIKTTAQRFGVQEAVLRRDFANRNKKPLQYQRATEETQNQVPQKNPVLCSAEEELIKIVLFDKKFLTKELENTFEDPFCKRVFDLALAGKDNLKIMNALGDDERLRFDILASNPPNYNTHIAFETLLRDLNKIRLKRKCGELKKDVDMMMSGQKEKNYDTLNKYQDLVRKLKGSRR